MGHTQQTSFFKTNWKHHLCHGGSLRNQRAGRGSRSLSMKEPLHVVFKVNRDRLKHGGLRHGVTYTLIHQIIRRYAKRFFVKVEQVSIQGDHAHLLVRAPRRAKFHHFFRVVAGQIAQRLEKEGLLAVPPAGSGKSVHPKSGSSAVKRNPVPTKYTQDLSRDRETNPIWSEQDIPKRNTSVTDTPQSPRKGTGLWKYRPYSRVVRGFKAYKIVRNCIQLNEQEALAKIPYRKSRLRGLSAGEWEILWV
jgi:REP element-mobilizing transposase RayT